MVGSDQIQQSLLDDRRQKNLSHVHRRPVMPAI